MQIELRPSFDKCRRMSSASIFKSLHELFPQVDMRILRAISIEHEDDINEAIEFILSEVLPVETTTPGFSRILHAADNQEQEFRERDNGPLHITIPDDKPAPPFGMPRCIGGAENKGLLSLVADGTNECVLGQTHLIGESFYNNSLSLNLNHLSEKEDESLYKAYDQNDNFESFLDGGSEKIILTEHLTKFCKELDCANMALHADTEELFQLRDKENISVPLVEPTISSTVFDNCGIPMKYGSEEQNDINTQLNVCDGCRPLNLHDSETVVYTPPALTCLLSLSDASEKDQIYRDFTTETYKDAMDNENHNLSFDMNYLEIPSDGNIRTISLASRSGHAVSIDVLEDSIKDAKNNKKSLVSSLESMASMMREVELLEGRVQQVEEEALVAGQDILCKVEELKHFVKRSKDENDMQSGQVYGERSILATEARELQSRLARISEEKIKYLSVTEEIFGALEARRSAAKVAIAAADLEKGGKEELGLRALKEQELLRDAVVAESQNLEQEADENSKLREFLMDRGHFVDSLQGEIAIICEDILSLKQRVDNPMSSTKSLMSSFSSSCGSPINSSDHNGGSPPSTSRPTNQETRREKLQEVESTAASSLEDLLDARSNPPLDDWEFCENGPHI